MNTGTSPNPSPARCLLLLPRAAGAPMDLLDALRTRAVRADEVADAPAAMVRLARQQFDALIIVEPDMIRDAAHLCRAAQKYHPRTAIWRYIATQQPRLQKFTADPAPTADPALDQSTSARTPEPPPAYQPTQPQPATPAPVEQPPDLAEPLLTDEELAMLLADSDQAPTDQTK